MHTELWGGLSSGAVNVDKERRDDAWRGRGWRTKYWMNLMKKVGIGINAVMTVRA